MKSLPDKIELNQKYSGENKTKQSSNEYNKAHENYLIMCFTYL